MCWVTVPPCQDRSCLRNSHFCSVVLMQTDKASKKCNAYSQISLFFILFLIIFSTLQSSVKKIFLRICFINNGVESQVILQSCSLMLERGNMMESRRYHHKLFTVVWQKDSICNLYQPLFINVVGFFGLSMDFLGQDASCSLLQSFLTSFRLKLWVLGLCFASWQNTWLVDSNQILKMLLCHNTELGL